MDTMDTPDAIIMDKDMCRGAFHGEWYPLIRYGNVLNYIYRRFMCGKWDLEDPVFEAQPWFTQQLANIAVIVREHKEFADYITAKYDAAYEEWRKCDYVSPKKTKVKFDVYSCYEELKVWLVWRIPMYKEIITVANRVGRLNLEVSTQ